MSDTPFAGWVTWKDDLPMRFPVVQMHDSGLVARHDQACYICGNAKAIYDITAGVFEPCDACHRKGWRLQRPKRWVPAWLRALAERLGGE